jgi:hypothetical protein
MPLFTRRNAAFAALAMMLVSALPSPHRPPDSDPGAADHESLVCFAETLRSRTPPHSTILFLLPEDEVDGGLINHRLRYLLPGRFILTNRDAGTAAERHRADYVAVWSRGTCDGTLSRAGR